MNCPNCGAPIEGDKCKYCGATIWNFAVIDVDNPSYVKFKIDGKIVIAKVFIKRLWAEIEEDELIATKSYLREFSHDVEINVKMGIVPENGILWKTLEGMT